jgi:predicted small lipoprotein YifL
MKMRAILVPLLLSGLAACVQPGPELPPVGVVDACRASEHRDLLGQSRERVAARSFVGLVRVLGPTDAATMDFQPTRINFATDARGTIVRVSCG